MIHQCLLLSVQLEGELPPKCFQEANSLNVPRVSPEDSGTYVCTASNKQGKVEAFTRLDVLGESAGSQALQWQTHSRLRLILPTCGFQRE